MQSEEYTKSWSAGGDASAISTGVAVFESELKLHGHSDLENWLERFPDRLRAEAFVELLHVEVRFRVQHGTELNIVDYRERFPEYGPQIQSVFAQHRLVLPQSSDDISMVSTAEGVQHKLPQNALPEISQPRDWNCGDVVGRYRLDAFVGRGGFGEVWRGFDPELSRIVAIKVPREKSLNLSSSSDPFLEEARRAALLRHEGIVPVFDVGRVESGFFIVSEYVDGPTLAQRMLQGAIPRDEAVRIVRELALILHKAHQTGLIHRDIKPSNILLRKDGTPAITDFGLAVSEEEQLTLDRVIVGTLPYMSPEQARGETHLMDGRSDLYSLGVILFQLLTGRMPFQHRSTTDLLDQIRHREVRPLRSIDDSIPVALDEICLKCLSKEVRNRYGTGRELSDALDGWNRVRSKWKTSSLLSIAAAALVCLFAVILLSRGWRDGPEPGTKRFDAMVTPIGKWLSMLDHPLEKVVSQKAQVSDFLQQDTGTSTLTARADNTFWIAATPYHNQAPLRMRGSIFLDDWLGTVGFVWGLSQPRDVFPKQPPRCYACVVERFLPTDPLTVSLRHIETEEGIPDILRIGQQSTIAFRNVEFPVKPFATFEVVIEKGGFQVLLDGQVVWSPEFPIPEEHEELFSAQGQVGFVLRGKSVVVREPMTQFLAPKTSQ